MAIDDWLLQGFSVWQIVFVYSNVIKNVSIKVYFFVSIYTPNNESLANVNRLGGSYGNSRTARVGTAADIWMSNTPGFIIETAKSARRRSRRGEIIERRIIVRTPLR